MAGGDAQILRAPYPKGDDGYICIASKAFDIAASKASDFIVDEQTVPFAFRAVYAEYTADAITETNAITFNVEDDTGTPQVLINDFACSGSMTAGASVARAMTVVKTITVNAGALLRFSYKSGASDTGTNCVIRIWVKPVF